MYWAVAHIEMWVSLAYNKYNFSSLADYTVYLYDIEISEEKEKCIASI